MAETVARWHQILIKAACTIVVSLTGLVGVTGCAVRGGNAGAGLSQEVITPSDEPEVRRRARIRLELAVNYFEMGKATVALDEVKQSLANDPTYADAYNLRGLIYMRLNDLAQAEDSFRGLCPFVLQTPMCCITMHGFCANSRSMQRQTSSSPRFWPIRPIPRAARH